MVYAERWRGAISRETNGIGRDARAICWRGADALTGTSKGCLL
jgi:hypothetical protein